MTQDELVAQATVDYMEREDVDRVGALDVKRALGVQLRDIKHAVPELADLGIRVTPGRFLEDVGVSM